MLKKSLLVTAMSVYLLILFSLVTISSYIVPVNTTHLTQIDTMISVDTPINVKNKISLFIGDSHTANFKNG